MPSLEWEYFLDTHYRPHLVIVILQAGLGRKAKHAEVLERLIEELGVVANYAMHHEDEQIRVAFERDLDASTFGKALDAGVTLRGGLDEWASETICSFDAKGKALR